MDVLNPANQHTGTSDRCACLEAADIVELVIRHGVRAVSYSRSPGKDMISRLKDHGVVCMPTIGLPKHAIKAVELGADVVTVQGTFDTEEAHRALEGIDSVHVVNAEDGRLVLSAAGEGAGSAKLLSRLLEGKLDVEGVSIQPPSLNGLFLKLTGRELRD